MGEYKNSLKTNGVKRIAYSGIEGSFASIAAGKIDAGAERVAFGSFKEAYDAVVSGDCDIAVLPIENSYAGEVGQVTDLMYSGELVIDGIYELPVIHCLLGVEGSSEETVKKVISHPQALEQCRGYIEDHKYKSVVCENTAVAARQVSEKGDVKTAAIASIETASLYGLKVIRQAINESNANTTRFAVFKKKDDKKSFCKGNHSILMFTTQDEAGALAKVLSILGVFGYNMKVIRSRPLKDVNWHYYFYTEIEGVFDCEDGQTALKALKRACDFYKVVGVFTPGLTI